MVQKHEMQFIRMIKGEFQLTSHKLPSLFLAKALCEIPREKVLCGDSRQCYQRPSLVCDEVKYNGEMDMTEMGYECAAWNDQSVHEHKYTEDVSE